MPCSASSLSSLTGLLFKLELLQLVLQECHILGHMVVMRAARLLYIKIYNMADITYAMVSPPVVAVIMSAVREKAVVVAAITAALNEPSIDSVHVWGYNPVGPPAVTHAQIDTKYHQALRANSGGVPLEYMSSGNKFSGSDSRARVLWRATLVLDMWQALREAQNMFPVSTIVYLENDAVLRPGCLRQALSANRSIACYSGGGARTHYVGSGALCFILKPSTNIAPHLLGYHLVQPADWIVGDYSKGRWPVVNCVTHGQPGRGHLSTRVL